MDQRDIVQGYWRRNVVVNNPNGERLLADVFVPGLAGGGSTMRVIRRLEPGEEWPLRRKEAKPAVEEKPRTTDPEEIMRLPGVLNAKEREILRQSVLACERRRRAGEE